MAVLALALGGCWGIGTMGTNAALNVALNSAKETGRTYPVEENGALKPTPRQPVCRFGKPGYWRIEKLDTPQCEERGGTLLN